MSLLCHVLGNQSGCSDGRQAATADSAVLLVAVTTLWNRHYATNNRKAHVNGYGLLQHRAIHTVAQKYAKPVHAEKTYIAVC